LRFRRISYRKTEKRDRPTFNQLEFCLNHKEDRILGSASKKKAERTRSITFSFDSEMISTDIEEEEQGGGDPSQVCRTE